MQTNDDCYQMNDECFQTNDEYSSVENFFERLLMSFDLRHDMYEKFGELDFISFYKYVLRHIEGREDVRNEDWIVILELEEMPVIQMYLNAKSSEPLDKSEEEVIEEIIRTIEEKKKASRNPIAKIAKYFKA